MNEKHIKNNFLVVSDYNWLPNDLSQSWVSKYSDNYLIYDRYHRFDESVNVKRQKNVGQNIYDIFDFIVGNYDNLPETTIFCRAAFIFPKDNGTPRYDENGNKLSNGNCSMEHFLKVANNTTFTELHDYGPEVHGGGPGAWSKYGPDGSYLEINNSWYFGLAKGKYYTHGSGTYNKFMRDMYINPKIENFIRFSPGGNYIIPKTNILRYSKKFYERIKEILEWDVVVGEAHMLERALYTIFTCNWDVQDKYK